MDIYLTDLETNERLRFPMLPDEISADCSSSFYSYNIINIGEIKIPSGEMPTGFSWSGKLPGEKRKNEVYVKEWCDPHEMQSRWSVFRRDKTKLRLLITETPINHDVYLDSYTVNYSGGYGDYDYTIKFIQAKELKIYTKSETQTAVIPDETPDGNNGEEKKRYTSKSRRIILSHPDSGMSFEESVYYSSDNPKPFPSRTSPPQQGTYTVVLGDSLWSISEKLMGGGYKYTKLYAANQSVIDEQNKEKGGEKYMIYPGQVLTIPR